MSLLNTRREPGVNDPPAEVLRIELGKALHAAQLQLRQANSLREQMAKQRDAVVNQQIVAARERSHSVHSEDDGSVIDLEGNEDGHFGSLTADQLQLQMEGLQRRVHEAEAAEAVARQESERAASRLAAVEANVAALQVQLQEAEARIEQSQDEVGQKKGKRKVGEGGLSSDTNSLFGLPSRQVKEVEKQRQHLQQAVHQLEVSRGTVFSQQPFAQLSPQISILVPTNTLVGGESSGCLGVKR